MNPILGNLFKKGGEKLVAGVGKILDDVITNKEEKAEIQLKIEQEVNRHIETLNDDAAKELELRLKDTQGARDRQVELKKAGGSDHLMYVSGYVALFAFLTMIYAVIWKPEAIKESALFHQLMGIIEGVALTIFTFYFGSSKGSADKTKMLK